MTQDWKVTDGIYRLLNPKNRGKLEDHFTELLLTTGKRPKVKGLLIGKDKKPYRLSHAAMDRVLAGEKGAKVKFKAKPGPSLRGRDMDDQISMQAREGFNKKGIEQGRAELDARSRTGPVKDVEAHHKRMLQMYRPFFEGLSKEDKAALADFAFESKYALGNDISNRALLSKPFHDQIHDFMREKGYQVSSAKIKKGYKYPGVPDLGNTLKSRKNALSHFFTNVQDPIERKLNTILWDQEDQIKPLTKKEMDYAASWFNDNERVAEAKMNRLKPQAETLELGRPLGGIGDKLQIGTGKTRKLDAAINIGANLAAGNTAGAAVQAGMLGTTEALKNKAVQKAMARQIAAIAAKRGSKSALKLIPGVDIGLSAKEAWDYATQGKWDQAGIAAASGAVGWVPGIGDAISAGLDLTNTGIDVSRMQLSDRKGRKNKTDVEAPTRRMKFKNL